jgi:hypothetical protein
MKNAVMTGAVGCFLSAMAAAQTNDGLFATLQTTMGEFSFELYYDEGPKPARISCRSPRARALGSIRLMDGS